MSSTHATTTERTAPSQLATSNADSPPSPEAVGDAVSAFVTEVTDALAAAEVPTTTIDAVADSGATLADQVATAIESAHKHPTDTQSADTARIEALETQVEELETALEEERVTRARRKQPKIASDCMSWKHDWRLTVTATRRIRRLRIQQVTPPNLNSVFRLKRRLRR